MKEKDLKKGLEEARKISLIGQKRYAHQQKVDLQTHYFNNSPFAKK